MMVTLLVGCTRVILGTVQALTPGAAPARIRLADLLIEPGQFPAGYPAVVLDATAVYGALQTIDGVAADSVVNPLQCAPRPRAPQDTAAVQGIDSRDANSLIVAVTRPATPLRDRAEQLTACPSFTAVHGQDTSAVIVTVLPAPPVDADDSYAVDQTVTDEASGPTRRTLTLAAQIGDVRVSATWLREGAPETTPEAAPDNQVLDTLFTDAVLKVRRVGGP
jgi:hypothetical protein